MDTLKEKLKWTEKQLQENLKKEAQTQAKLMVIYTDMLMMVLSLVCKGLHVPVIH